MSESLYQAAPRSSAPDICSFNGGCGGGSKGANQQQMVAPTVMVTPSSSSITTAQSLGVATQVSASGGTPTGSVTLSRGGYSSGATTIATTDSSGVASVKLTLPSSPGTVTATAQDMFALGGVKATFTEVAS